MIEAERALHARLSWAPSGVRTWEQDGLLAAAATDPALGFLSTISGVTAETVPEAIDLLHAPTWEPTLVLPPDLVAPKGLTPAGVRPLAVARLPGGDRPDPAVTEAADGFVDVLLAGYEVSGRVAEFIAADHSLPVVRRFLLVDGETPIAAAAMTVHGRVAVLGGASTLRAHRGKGAQSRLLRHRLHAAAGAGCDLAVATAAADSTSAANLRRAGFQVHQRTAWILPR